jgi:malonate transporter and related proteins
MLSSSATPVFGIAVLQPLLGKTSAGTVGLVALAINFVMPMAIIFLEMNSAKMIAGATGNVHTSSG